MTQNVPRDSNIPQTQPPTLPKPISLTSTGLSGLTAGANSSNVSRASRLPETQRPAIDSVSDKATAAFIRRTLCAHNVLSSNLGNGEKGRSTPRPIDELLPPLTSSNDVDLHLYAIIAVIIKEFVYTWYSKITPDHVFVNEVIQVIAHCTRGLEQRLRKVDLEALLLDEIPELLEAHLNAYRISQKSSCHNPLTSNPRSVYHTLRPHPALSPVPIESDPTSVLEQRQNEAAWRQLLVQGVLVVLLPTEDLENGCLRVLVAEIFAEMILGNGVSDKACEGWLLWEGITRIAEVLQADTEKEASSNQRKPEQTKSRLERYGLLSSSVEKAAEPVKPSVPNGRPSHEGLSVSGLFWLVVQYAFLACNAMRAVIIALATSSSLPPRSVTGVSVPSPMDQGRQSLPQKVDSAAFNSHPASKRPIVSMRLWSCTSGLLELDVRMPWLSGLVSLLHWGAVAGPGRVGDTDGVLDKLLAHTIRTYLLNSSNLPPLLRSVRVALFPSNTLAPPRAPPTSAEAQAIKRRCAATLLAALPSSIACRFFATRDRGAMQAQIEILLDCLGDSYLNKHLVFSVLELIVVRLVPEMAEKGVVDLMEERLGYNPLSCTDC